MKDDDLDKDMSGWLRSQQIDAAADYVRRGRQFSELSLPDLTERWAATFKDRDEYMRSQALRALSADYTSEFGLRNIEPPMSRVGVDFAKIQKAVKKMIRGMPKEARDDLVAGVAGDLDVFRWQRDQGKN